MTDDELVADNLADVTALQDIGVILVSSRDNLLSCLASVYAIEIMAMEALND